MFDPSNLQNLNSLQADPWDFLSKAIPGSSVADFGFCVPAEIAKADGRNGQRPIRGVASTPAVDLQSETVVQKGMDLRYFLKHGYFNDDHKPGFKNKVGQPTVAVIKRVTDSTGNKVLGLWVEGYLWAKGTHAGADAIRELALALAASGSDRQLGFSIQGKVLQRDGNKILKAWIQDIAITPSPVNTRTWMELVNDMAKSWATVDEMDTVAKSLGPQPSIGEPDADKALAVAGGSPVVPESLEEDLKVQTYSFGPEKRQGGHKDEVDKAIRAAYTIMRERGHNHDTASRGAVAAVAKTLLLQ